MVLGVRFWWLIIPSHILRAEMAAAVKLYCPCCCLLEAAGNGQGNSEKVKDV
jgi:hypothetical protein